MKLVAWMLVACGVAMSGTLVACGSSDDGNGDSLTALPDASPVVDSAASSPDASSPTDASSTDAATVADATATDAAAPQDAASPPADAAVPDAGPEDSGTDAAPDAAPDSGPARVECLLNAPLPGGNSRQTFTSCNGAPLGQEMEYFGDDGQQHECTYNPADMKSDTPGNCPAGNQCTFFMGGTGYPGVCQ